MRTNRRTHHTCALAGMLLAILPCHAESGPATPIDGIQAALSAFDSHSLVAIADYHDMQELHDFINALIRSPRFHDQASEIVVEWGNSLYQDLADRYLLGGEMTPPETV